MSISTLLPQQPCHPRYICCKLRRQVAYGSAKRAFRLQRDSYLNGPDHARAPDEVGVERAMKPTQAFGVAVRILGLLSWVAAFFYFLSAFIAWVAPDYRAGTVESVMSVLHNVMPVKTATSLPLASASTVTSAKPKSLPSTHHASKATPTRSGIRKDFSDMTDDELQGAIDRAELKRR